MALQHEIGAAFEERFLTLELTAESATGFYRDRLGFSIGYTDENFGIVAERKLLGILSRRRGINFELGA